MPYEQIWKMLNSQVYRVKIATFDEDEAVDQVNCDTNLAESHTQSWPTLNYETHIDWLIKFIGQPMNVMISDCYSWKGVAKSCSESI